MRVLAQLAQPTTSPEAAELLRAQGPGLWARFISAVVEWQYTISNIIVLLLLLLLVWAVIYVRRNKYWREAAARVFCVRRAQISFVVLLVFFSVGVIDSVRWRPYKRGTDGHIVTRMVEYQGGLVEQLVLDASPMSLLDWIDMNTLKLGSRNERTYSSPLADVAFSKKTQPNEQGLPVRVFPELEYPGAHVLGTDQIGQDVLYKAIKGIRTALIIGGFTTMLAVPFALLFGMTAGYYGKLPDDIVTYIYTVIASIPRILLIIAFVLIAGQGLLQLCLIMAVTTWVSLGRLIRAEVLKVREMEYVQAARSVGATNARIQFRHILPNVFHLVIIQGVLMFSTLVLAEAVLSYLGVGVGGSTPSWGNMINQGQLELSRQPVIWWNLLAAFAFMFTLLLSANVFGDAVRDALDPHLVGV